MKSGWYVDLSKRSNEHFSEQEKDVWVLVLEKKVDDLADVLGDRRKRRIEDFGIQLFKHIVQSAQILQEVVDSARERGITKKDFVSEIRNMKSEDGPSIYDHPQIFYKCFDSEDLLAFDQIVETVIKHCKTHVMLEKVRDSICGGVSIKLKDNTGGTYQ
eukprot:TRINITY_DN6180_c0_g1_i1.p1 TRINITY_DN6180_c0_g1~~TRINITY_DN6180_c0_g1_i1.p1  ORF type:complete len:159 (-),score=38.80 TRINITY_DN6180_c0_g1_i1:15-491(-)